MNNLLGGDLRYETLSDKLVGILHVNENLLLWVVESRLSRGVLEHTDLGSAKVRFHHLSELSKINTEGVDDPLDSDAVLLVE